MVIVGLGNRLMGDDGVGVWVVQALMARDLPSWVEVVEVGTGGWTLLHVIEGAQKVIFIDAVSWGGSPGQIIRFRPEEVVSSCASRAVSLHTLDLLDALDLAHEIGECPEEVVIYGIQPRSVAQGMELSPDVAAALPEVVDRVLEEMQRFSNSTGGTFRG